MGNAIGCSLQMSKAMRDMYMPVISATAKDLVASGVPETEAWARATESQIKLLTQQRKNILQTVVDKYEAEYGEVTPSAVQFSETSANPDVNWDDVLTLDTETKKELDKLHKMYKLYGGQEGYALLQAAATGYLLRAPHSPPRFTFRPELATSQKLKRASDRIYAEISELGGGPEGVGREVLSLTERSVRSQIGFIKNGYTTNGRLVEIPGYGRYFLVEFRALDIAETGGFDDSPLITVVLHATEDSDVVTSPNAAIVINGPDFGSGVYQYLASKGHAETSKGKDGKPATRNDGTPYTNLTGTGVGNTLPMSQVSEILAESHARLRLVAGADHLGMMWVRDTGANGEAVEGNTGPEVVHKAYFSEVDAKAALAEETSAWKQVVAGFVAGKYPGQQYVQLLSSTPAVMQLIGAPNLPVNIRTDHGLNYVNDRLTPEQMSQLPAELADPVAVYVGEDTLTGKLSAVFVTKLHNANGVVLVAVNPNNNDPRAGHTNFAATIMVKPVSEVTKRLGEGRALYVGNSSHYAGVTQAVQNAKREKGAAAVKFRDSFSRQFSLRHPATKVLYKSDAVKLVESGAAKYSEGEATTPHTKDSLRKAIARMFFSPQKQDSLVTVFDTAAEAVAQGQLSQDMEGKAVAWVKNGKVYLIADKIGQGKEAGVVLHEIGVHLGMEKLIGAENMQQLREKITEWALRNDGSVESIAANNAIRRAENSSSTNKEDEVVAYMVEELVNAGVVPTATNGSDAATWLNTLLTAMRSALTKLGINAQEFTPQDLVNLAMGSAQSEMGSTQAEPAPVKVAELPPTPSVPLTGAAKRYWRNLTDAMHKHNPMMLTMQQLAEQFGKLTTLKNHVRLLDRMSMEQRKMLDSAQRVIPAWAKLKKPVRDALNQLMHDSTMAGIHPDEAFGKGGNDHLSSGEDLLKHRELAGAYSRLPAEAQAVYKSAKESLAYMWKQRQEFYAGVVMAHYKPLIERAAADKDMKGMAQLVKDRNKEIAAHDKKLHSLKGPYFPLMRFGDRIAVVMSTEMKAKMDSLIDAKGDQHAAMTQEIRKMKKDKHHYMVRAFENQADAEQFVSAQTTMGMVGSVKLADEHFQGERPVSPAGLEKLSALMDSQFDKSVSAQLKKAMTEMYLSSLPEHSSLQREIERIGVEGASVDMLRAFSEVTERDSFHLSRLKFTKDIAANMFAMKREVNQSGVDMQHVYRNVNARLALDYEYDPTPVQNAVARLSSFWHLSVAPSFLLQNMTQPWMVSVPELAGKYGGARTFGAFRSAWADASKLIPEGKEGVLNLRSMDFSKLPAGHETDMLEYLRELGQLDITQNQDMGMLADGASPKMMKLAQVFGWATHHIELHNRITTALAAYRLELNNKPGDFTGAREAAHRAVTRTQLDYSASNAAYFMRAGPANKFAGKLIWQFRKYQQGMVYLVLDNAKKAFKGDKEAMRSLGYLMASQMAVSGIKGIPFIVTPLAVFALFADDGDDPDGDTETQLRNFMADAFGADVARVLWSGAPSQGGVDLSGSLGMGSIFFPLPYSDVRELASKSGKEAVGGLAVASAGAWTGTAANWIDAVGYFNEGKFDKGFEKALPKFLSSPVKAANIGEDGMTNRNGLVKLPADRFDGWDLAFKSMGFTPTVEAEHWQALIQKNKVSKATHDKTKQLKDKFVELMMAGESPATLMQDVAAFNQKHPSNRITYGELYQALSARRRLLREGTDEAGVSYRKNEDELRPMDRYAK